MPSILYDTEYWRTRAEEARVLADQITDPETKRLMEGIAKGYDNIARLSVEQARIKHQYKLPH